MCLNTYIKAFVVPRTACSMTRVLSYGLSPWRPRSDPGLVHVRHVVDKVVLGQVSLSVLPLPHLIIPAVFHTHYHFNKTEKRTSVWGFKPPNIVIPFQMFRNINRLTPNDPYMGRTAPLTSKRCILYIYSTNRGTEYFKHTLYSPFFLFKMQFVS